MDMTVNELFSGDLPPIKKMISLKTGVTLRVFTFPAQEPQEGYPDILLVPGWISVMDGWAEVLREMRKDFTIHYVETREKKSSLVVSDSGMGVADIAADLRQVIVELDMPDKRFVLLGSSLGATAILDMLTGFPEKKPMALVLINPNARFRDPLVWKIIISLFYPPFYVLLKPVIKWYLRVFRMKVSADRAQYDKYCHALDLADPVKLKKAAMSLWSYRVWGKLESVAVPALVIGASQDSLHEPESIERMVTLLPDVKYVDMHTNTETHSREMVAEVRRFLAELD